MTDPFAGRITFFKVISGVIKNDATVENYTRRGQERLSHLSVMQGRKAVEVPELHAGDLGAVAKLRDTLTGDTLGQKGAEIQVDLHPLPEPAMTYAIEPKTRADEDKLAPAIHKLMEEDLLIRFFRDPQTNEFLIAGAGQPHIEAIVSRLKKRYHAEVTLKAPKVPYRETIRAKVEAPGRHKKQTGGHGQFGDCKIRMEPMPRGGGFEFANEVFGGAIPRNFIPAIEKGIVESAARGYLAGFPVVDFKAIVYDGSYHDVDSNEMSFKMAGRIAFRKAMETAKPCLLEPIMKVEIEAPDEFAGTLMGDLNSRRGRVAGHGLQGPHHGHQRPGPHGRDADLRHASNFHDARQRQLPHGDGPLRHRPAASSRQNPGQRQAAGGGRGRITIASSGGETSVDRIHAPPRSLPNHSQNPKAPPTTQSSAGLPAGCSADVLVRARLTGVKSRHGARIFFRTPPRRRAAAFRRSPHSQSRPPSSLGKRRRPLLHHLPSRRFAPPFRAHKNRRTSSHPESRQR